jgi:hypothetical protein
MLDDLGGMVAVVALDCLFKKVGHACTPRYWPNTPLPKAVPSPFSFGAPILLRLAFDRRRGRILDLDPVIRPGGAEFSQLFTPSHDFRQLVDKLNEQPPDIRRDFAQSGLLQELPAAAV